MIWSDDCEPYLCPLPRPSEVVNGEDWKCPYCGTKYQMVKPDKPRPWWLRWWAPDGRWRVIKSRRPVRSDPMWKWR